MLTGPPIVQIWKESRRGKSLARILANHILREQQEEMRGLILDLGCGRGSSSSGIWRQAPDSARTWVGVDRSVQSLPEVVADLQSPFPFRDNVAVAVLVFSFLYIVADPQVFLREVRRVLKADGLLLLSVPLVYPYHPEPTDYWRFTEQGLQLLLESTGFAQIRVFPFGGRWTSSAYLLSPFLRPLRFMIPLVYWVCLKLDAWASTYSGLPLNPIGYVVKAKASP